MSIYMRQERWLLLTLVLAWSLGHTAVRGDQKDASPRQTSVDKIRKNLDQPITLDFQSQSFQEAVRHLKDKTGLNFVLDMFVLQQMGLGFEENPVSLELKGDGTKLRQVVQRMLSPYNLTLVVLEDTVVITTEEMGQARQLRQRVNVNVAEVPLAKALQDLARTASINLVMDPRLKKEAQTPVTLQLEDATLETAVRLLAELGGVKSVRVGNVLFVTSEARAEKLRQEEPALPHGGNPMVIGAGVGGVAIPPMFLPAQNRAAGAAPGMVPPPLPPIEAPPDTAPQPDPPVPPNPVAPQPK